MTYLFTDFLVLVACTLKNVRTVGDAFCAFASDLAHVPEARVFCHALAFLQSGGVILLQDGAQPLPVVDEAVRVSITPEGRAAATLSGIKKLFGGKAAYHKLEDAFTARQVPEAEIHPVSLADGAYAAMTARLAKEYVVLPENPFSFVPCHDGIRITVREPNAAEDETEEETLPDEHTSPEPSEENESRSSLISLVGGSQEADEYIRPGRLTVTDAPDRAGFDSLLAAVCDMLDGPVKTRKTALVGPEGGYILTLSPDTDGVRLSATSIRFNKSRFRGKRDGDLDYAQCGNTELDGHLSPYYLEYAALWAYTAVSDLLSPAQLAVLKRFRNDVR